MGIVHPASAVLIFLTGLLPAGCHKGAPAAKSAPPRVAMVATNTPSVAALSTNCNLGVIALVNHDDTCLQLADGETCTLSTRVLDRRNVEITLAVETRNTFGETHDLAVTQIVTQPNKATEVAVGDLNLTFTPQITE
jgi:hypothetical protein